MPKNSNKPESPKPEAAKPKPSTQEVPESDVAAANAERRNPNCHHSGDPAPKYGV